MFGKAVYYKHIITDHPNLELSIDSFNLMGALLAVKLVIVGLIDKNSRDVRYLNS
jgi:hypothetical protein